MTIGWSRSWMWGRSMLRPSPSRHSVLFGDIATRRPSHHPELIQPHHRVVAHLELEAGLLLQLTQEVRLLLHEVERDLGMEPDRKLPLFVIRAGSLDRAIPAR